MGTSNKEKNEMNGIEVKKTTTTQMKVKKATIDEGKVFVDGEEINLLDILCDTFDGSIFDITVTEKTEIE